MTLTRVLKDIVGIDLEATTRSDTVAVDRSTQLAIERTDLALERSLLAAERTLMAWIRTSLAWISFGFTLGKLGDAVRSVETKLLFGRTTDILGVAYFLVITGTMALILAAAQYRIEVAELCRRGLKGRPSLAFLMAVLLSLLGIVVFADLVNQFQ
jgi:putative membrane protein